MQQLMRRLSPIPNRSDDERGLVAVWVAICMVVFLGFAAWAVDFAHWNDERTHMQKAADAAALAGAVYLPDDPAGAINAAKQVASQNGYSSGVSVSTLSSGNQLKVVINQSVNNVFGVAIGTGSTDLSKQAVSEYESPTPLDIVLILDRTGSMNCRKSASCSTPDAPPPTPLDEVKSATKAVLGFLNPKNESIALGVLPPSDTTKRCAGTTNIFSTTSSSATGGAGTTWMVAPYPLTTPSNDYQQSDGTLNPNSQIVKTIDCIQAGGSTDLGDPVIAATNYLKNYSRPGARKGIILMTDGAANAANDPVGANQPCQYAENAATTAKAAGIQLLTIGFLSGSNICGQPNDSEKTGKYVGAQVTKLLAAMASPIKGVPAADNGCVDAENKDGDNFFCAPKGGDIKAVFLAAIGQLANRLPRIIQ